MFTSEDGFPCFLRSSMLFLCVLVLYNAYIKASGSSSSLRRFASFAQSAALCPVFLQYRHWSSCNVFLGTDFGVCCFFFGVDVFGCVVLSSYCFFITVICILTPVSSDSSPFNSISRSRCRTICSYVPFSRKV